ncbi:hypothetical protein HMI54_000934 [Coelomomyces lativittatus]|nr:hypothetical protein HMI56_003917 [Coelomomyces lativittatus]KAJ1516673.1 hypothetical protein HMI55_001699 [Coelomomyces lativittatus]KAJ1518406.1 hypothetical protein HMI54_000934 [Coelomomyces lativittatus]
MDSNPLVPMAIISRTEQFSSAHRLHSFQLTEKQNVELYGLCNHKNYHGHNYTLEVCIQGPINTITGMVVNLTDLKKCIHETVLHQLDHRNLDLDVDYFQTRPSTTENLCVFIFDLLQTQLSNYIPEMNPSLTPDLTLRPRLLKVIIWETLKNKVEYSGAS